MLRCFLFIYLKLEDYLNRIYYKFFNQNKNN